MWRFVSISFVACALSGALWADVATRGTEFQVNTYTTGSQGGSSVASDAAGNFVVVWISDEQGGPGTSIFGQRFDRNGVRKGPEFRVNTHTSSNKGYPAVASDAAGNFVVVWQSWYQDGSLSGIFGRRFDRTGAPRGSDFQVNTNTAGYQERPAVASNARGDFVVVWSSLDQDGSGWGGFGQLFDRTGAPTGYEFQVNTYTTGAQAPSSVALDSFGDFVVVWTSDGQDGSDSGVFGQRFDDTATPRGLEFRINTHTTDSQASPSVASDADGNFVVAWQSWGQGGHYWEIFSRQFDGTGTPAGPEIPVNTFKADHQSSPRVVLDPAGNFVVAWSSYWQDDSSWGAFGQRFDATGSPTGSEFRINTYTSGSQGLSSIASDSGGNFVATWNSPDQDGSESGVFAQRYYGRAPTLTNPLAGDTVDCSNPQVIRPTITWDDDGYDRFRVYIGWDPAFGTGRQVTSGDTLLRAPSWTPPVKKWRKACANALAVNPGSPTLHVKVFGVDTNLPTNNPARKSYGEVVQVDVQQ